MEDQFLLNSGIITGLFALATAYLKHSLGKKLNEMTEELKRKHTQFEIVYQEQKESFKRLIRAMNEVLASVHQGEPPWTFISRLPQARTIREELLFVENPGKESLNLFLTIAYEAVNGEEAHSHGAYEAHDIIESVYDQLDFLSESIFNFFQHKMGLIEQETLMTDVHLLRICRFFAAHHAFKKSNYASKLELRIGSYLSPMDLVRTAKENLNAFRAALSEFAQSLKPRELAPGLDVNKVSEVKTHVDTLDKLAHGWKPSPLRMRSS